MEKILVMNKFVELKNLSKIVKDYECFFIDLWGVVHNGFHLFENVKDVLERLKEREKKIFFLTNAPRRSTVIKKQLLKFGLDNSHYDDVISSGEISWQRMKEKKKINCYLIGPPRDHHLIEGLDFNVVNETSSVDLIVNTGPWGDDDTLENYKPILNKLIKKKPLMICSNPDKTVVRGEKFMICAGLLAEYYENIGGKVEYYGKPHKEIYQFTFSKISINKEKILIVGDSLDNDIKGANSQKIDSLLITSGIHREVNNHNGVDKDKLNDLIKKKKIVPKYFMKDLIF